ncbi:MAG: antibiotic biosynthesis monooxygenase [Pseudooceanicola sp.]|nr:antibiotic biosynthesis monooxygenase [Pseudooceanicola sp.]
MGQVSLNGHLDVPPDRLAAVLAALPEHVRLTRAEPGCLTFNVVQDRDLPTRLLVSETFASPDAFRAHQARAKGTHWARITEGIPRHYTITGMEP